MDIRDIIQAPREFIDEFLFKPFHLIDMHKITDETLREQHWAGVMGFVMKNIFARDFLPHVNLFLEMLQKLISIEGAGGTYIFSVTMLKYILNASEISNLNEFISQVQDNLHTDAKEDFMTAAEGLRQQGAHTMATNTLIDLLISKFGNLPSSYCNKISNAKLEQLSLWTKKIIVAKSVNQIFEEELVS